MVNVFHNSLSKYRHNDPYSLNDQAVSINYKWDKLKTTLAYFWDILFLKGISLSFPFLCYVVFFFCGYFNLRPSALFIAWFLSLSLSWTFGRAFLYYSSIFCKWWDLGGMTSIYIKIGGIHPTSNRPQPTTPRISLLLHVESKSYKK